MPENVEIPLDHQREITLSEVLIQIEYEIEFSISWVRDSGKNKGSIKTVSRAIKGTKKSDAVNRQIGKATAATQKKWQFKKYDMIPIVDVEHDQMLTPKWTHIIEFNDKKVRHYGK